MINKKILGFASTLQISSVESDLAKISGAITNPEAQKLIRYFAEACGPERVVLYTNTPAQRRTLLAEAVNEITHTPVNDTKMPYTFMLSLPLGPVHTFSCAEFNEELERQNKPVKAEADKAKSLMLDRFKGVMAGRTLYVVPAQVGSPGQYLDCGIRLCDSAYAAVYFAANFEVNDGVLARLNSIQDSFLVGLASEEVQLASGEKLDPWPYSKSSLSSSILFLQMLVAEIKPD